jgi:LmbE family N-acetylglucosaminyl deacetylase
MRGFPPRHVRVVRFVRVVRVSLFIGLGCVFGATSASAQERGANALSEAVLGLGVNPRVLLIGAHPDDEDTNLIAWLSRGRHIETAYLSLTRGDGGQNVIGNELGEQLGVIRTQELLAARRIDGARQYFSRAFDFGFSKDTVDTYRHWQKDSILGDVVRIVRAFRPHVIVAVFSGTSRDGHGQHQVAGLLAREAFDLAADTVRFPTSQYDAAWAPLKFYRAQRGNAEGATLSLDAGEFVPALGLSLGEIAGESRSQHKSQAFGALERKGPIANYLRREASRVNESTPATNELSMFEGIDTTWGRFRRSITNPVALAALDSLPAAFHDVRRLFDALAPHRSIPPLARAQRLVNTLCAGAVNACERIEQRGGTFTRTLIDSDLAWSVDEQRRRLDAALRLASGVAIEATASRELWPLGSEVPVHVAVYNRSTDTIAIAGGVIDWRAQENTTPQLRLVPPGTVFRDTLRARMDSIAQPRWLVGGRESGMFAQPASAAAEELGNFRPAVGYTVDMGGRRRGAAFGIIEPVVYRFADDVRGELRRPIAGVPAISVTLPAGAQYARANTAIDRTVDVTVRSAAEGANDIAVSLVLPRGLTADSVRRVVRLERGAERVVRFRVRGRLAAGAHRIAAQAQSEVRRYDSGYSLIDYEHIAPQRVYRQASALLQAIDVRVPARLRVGYVRGVSDNIVPALQQLGIPVTVIAPEDLARADLARYTTIVVGPRAYDAHPQLVASNARLLEFARRGGTLLVQYGQYEMTQPGITPFAITIARPHDRVTQEEAPVTIVDAGSRWLNTPNTITARDFEGWVQERSLYMPRTFASQYRPLLSMNDPGEPPRNSAVLVARVGRGYYVYTTLAFFRQLPAGVPGAARLFVNLLSVTPPPAAPPRR